MHHAKESRYLLSDYVSGKRMRAKIGGVEYEIQTYQGKHSNEYLLCELRDGKIEGRCQLFKHGILYLAWTMKNGKREGEITEYWDGKVLHKENWNSIFGEDGNRRMIENTKEGLIMTIRCTVKPEMNDKEYEVRNDEENNVNDEIVIYRGGFDKEMNRYGHGIEYDMESGKEKLEGYWEKDKLVQVIREFDADSNQMIEYVVNDNLEIWNRIPVYIGGYCEMRGTFLRNGLGYLIDENNGTAIRESFLRNGLGYLIDENNGTAIRESKWNYGKEMKGIALYEGWYMKGLQESIRSVLRNKKPEEIKNEIDDVIGDTITISKNEELIVIDNKVNDLVISSNSCNEFNKLHLNQFNWLRSIVIGDDCLGSVKSFELKGLNRLKTLKIGSNSFTQKKNSNGDNKSKSFHILNCESLESIEIGQYSFSDFGGVFELKNLPQLQSVQFESCNFYGNSFVIRGIDIEY